MVVGENRDGIGRGLRWAFIALALVNLSSCSSVSPRAAHRRGLFDDLASSSSASGESRYARSASGRIIASEELSQSDIQARPTGNPVIDKPRSKKERAAKAAAFESSPEQAQQLKSAGLRWPLLRVEVTSPFGKRGREFHEGVDLRANPGTPIYAAQAGTVIYADSKINGYGKMVLIKHRGGLATVYAHASKLIVRRGQKVVPGQKIAFSGQSGHATGPHLHFEIRSGVVAVNPYKFLPKHEVAEFRTGRDRARAKIIALRSKP